MKGQKHKHIFKLKQNKKPLVGFDYLIYFFTFATPLFELPQLLEVYTHQSAQDVSIWTWAFFCLDNFVWITYALRRKLLPLFITSVLFEVIELGILLGIILYR